MQQSFRKNKLRLTFTLANNAQFEGTNSNVLVLEGYRARVNVKSAGATVAPAASMQVFGVRQSDMNALTMLAWRPLGLQPNTVKIEASFGSGWAAVFQGDIITAGPDYTAAPDVFLQVQAVSIYTERLKPAPPTAYVGSVDVADVIEKIVTDMGFNFENNGVSVQIASPYLVNTFGEQLITLSEQANIDVYIDGAANTIAITPRGQPRVFEQVELNAQSGLIGYPTIDINGLQVQSLYNPGLRFGGPVHITSDIPRANGDWYIYSLDHDLQTETPNGAWFSNLGVTSFENLVVLP